jgi:hypothetical protein
MTSSTEFDFIIVCVVFLLEIMRPEKGAENRLTWIHRGGGTAGCVLANRLTEDPQINVLVIEGGSSLRSSWVSENIADRHEIGPDDRKHPEVLQLKFWLSLLGGPLDYRYTTTEQPRGNSHIIHSRAKVLGTFIPFKSDVELPMKLMPWFRRLFLP